MIQKKSLSLGVAVFVESLSHLAANGSRLCEVADFQHKWSIEKLNLNLALNFH
jgi:hypothetical protein